MQHRISREDAGQRLDRLLVALVPGWSRSRLQDLIKSGAVTVDGASAPKPGVVLEVGQTVAFELPELAPASDPQGRSIKDLPILFADEHLAIVNKPAGLLSHANDNSGRETVVTLAEKVLGPLPPSQEPWRQGIVHRLDRLTSGLMVLARTSEAMAALQEAFAAREVEKTYLALVHHDPRFETEWIEAPLEKDPRRPGRMRVAPEGSGRPAATLMVRREVFRGHALVAAHPKTGRTHQVRVHLFHAGHPIIGDEIYRQPGALSQPLPEEAPVPHRPCLHAAALSFCHPMSGEVLAFEQEIPADMQTLLDWLRANRCL